MKSRLGKLIVWLLQRAWCRRCWYASRAEGVVQGVRVAGRHCVLNTDLRGVAGSLLMAYCLRCCFICLSQLHEVCLLPLE